MKFIRLLAVLIVCVTGWVNAQTPYYMQPDFRNANSNWIFGRIVPSANTNPPLPDEDSAMHIDFNTNPPTISRKYFWVPLSRPGTRQATVTVSDPVDGSLLFYTEGIHVWNRKQQIMPNGAGLKGDDYILYGYYRLGMHQGFCAIPVFGSRDRYYLFNLTHAGTNTTPAYSKLYYSIIDMSLDGGYGDVDVASGFKNVPLDTFAQTMFGEAITAVPGDNCDVWLLTYDRGIMGYKAFHITDQGVNPVPVISSSISGIGIFDMMQGSMSFSPDRKMIAMAYNYNAAIIGYPIRGGLVAKFDPATGRVSDEILVTTWDGGSASAFSPDNSKLYLSSRAPVNGNTMLAQYDLSVYDPLLIRQSRYLIDSGTAYGDGMRRRDDKILLVGIGGEMGVIMKPDLRAPACDVRYDWLAAVGAKDTVINSMSLGNDVIFPLPPQTFSTLVLDTFICRIDKDSGFVLNAPPGGVDHIWDNGQTGTSRKIRGQGRYWVRYGKGCNTFVDSFTVRESAYPPPVINVNGNRLYVTGNNYTSYQWFRNDTLIGGANTYEYFVTKNAGYQVAVGLKDGCSELSGIYSVNNVSVAGEAHEAAMDVYPNPASGVVYIRASGEVRWQLRSVDGRKLSEGTAASVSLQGLPRGLYLLEIRSLNGDYPVKKVKLVKE